MLPTVLQRSVGLRGQIGQISTFPSVGNSSGGETVVISESHVLLMSKGRNGEKEVFSNYRLHFKKLWNMVEILNSTPPPAHCSVFQSVLVVGYFLILLFFFFLHYSYCHLPLSSTFGEVIQLVALTIYFCHFSVYSLEKVKVDLASDTMICRDSNTVRSLF